MTRTVDLATAVSMFALAIGSFFLLLLVVLGKPHDAISFWASGRLLLHHENPYDAALVGTLEQSVGYNKGSAPLIMRNPPYALLIALPLGLFGLRTATLVWSGALLATLILSVRLMRTNVRLLGYTFGPAVFCIFAGQSALYTLLGIVLFVRFQRVQPFWAGVALWLCMLKPHLLLPFAVALLLSTIYTRNYRVLLGAGTAVCLSNGVAMLFDVNIWRDYRHMISAPEFGSEFIPCLGVALRDWSHLPWMQFAPAAVGMLWAGWFFWMHRARWDWVRHGNSLLLVSLLVAPYAWFTDHAIVLPALLYAAAQTKNNWMPVVLAVVNSAIVIVAAAVPLLRFHSPGAVGLAFLWPCLYLLARAGAAPETGEGGDTWRLVAPAQN
jgi:hypothetical protein